MPVSVSAGAAITAMPANPIASPAAPVRPSRSPRVTYARAAARSGWVLAMTAANPGEMNSAAWNMPRKPSVVAPSPATVSSTHWWRPTGRGRRWSAASPSRAAPARTARSAANVRCGARAIPSLMSGKHAAHSPMTSTILTTGVPSGSSPAGSAPDLATVRRSRGRGLTASRRSAPGCLSSLCWFGRRGGGGA